MELVRETFTVCADFISACCHNSLWRDLLLNILFGKSTTTAKVVDEAPGEEEIPYKIPMKIIERVVDNRYEGDGTVHPRDYLLFLHELCGLFKCAGISMDEVTKKLFSMSLSGKAAHWYKLLKNGDSLDWEDINCALILF